MFKDEPFGVLTMIERSEVKQKMETGVEFGM